ncbi:MAG: fibronectin type III domain-containing protein [Bacteroidales bacterium]|jgi:hypothetical protein|nr:fibronectin type III domain-containing protein [Bacteroidales bacterium]
MRKLLLLFGVFLMLVASGFAQVKKSPILGKQKMHSTIDITTTPSKDVLVNTNKEAWDIAFTFDASAAANPGIETDGQNFYTVSWNSTTFTRYDMDGSNAETFDVPGVSAVRDMAYDGTYFYGAAADMNLFQMDLENETLISTITATCTGVTGIRHIAYDPNLDSGNGGFWIGNWGELGAIAMDGSELVASTATIESCYGSAYDPWTDPANPCLWLFQQPNGSEAVFYQFDINTYSYTGTTHDCSDAPGFIDGSISGGACSYEADGMFYLVGSIQQEPNLVVAYELATTADPAAPAAVSDLTATPDAGGALTADVSWTNPSLDFSGNTLTELTSIDLYLDGSETPEYTNASPTIGGAENETITVLTAGFHAFKVIGTNSAGVGVPTTVTVWVGEDVPAAPTNVGLTNTDMEISLTWDAPTEGLHGEYFTGTGVTYTVVRYPGEVVVSEDQAGLTFSETLSEANNYYYEIIASNASGQGGVATSETILLGDVIIFDFEAGLPEGGELIDGDCGWLFGNNGSSDYWTIPEHGNYAYANDDQCNGDMSDVWMILPPVDFTEINAPWIKFENVRNSDIFTIKASLDGTTWDDVEVLSTDNISAWQEETVDLTAYANEPTVFIAFHYNDDGAWGYGWAVDDVMMPGSIITITCPKPTDLTVTDITTNSAVLGWTSSSDTWNIEWGTPGFTQGEGTLIEGTSDNPYTLSDLDSGTAYEFYVQADCGGGDLSFWAGPVQFTTLYDCSSATITSLPYTTSFDTEEPCWVIEQNNANVTWEWQTGEYTCLYDDALGLQNEWLITPKFDFSAVTDNIAVSFTWLASYYYSVDPYNNYDMFLKVSTNGTDWVSLWDETDEGVFESWTEYTTTVNANAYSGEASVWFAFNYYGTDGAQWTIMDFTVDVFSKSALNVESNISVYPNPANSIITIANAENENIVVLNMLGVVVANISNASSNQTIDISNL